MAGLSGVEVGGVAPDDGAAPRAVGADALRDAAARVAEKHGAASGAASVSPGLAPGADAAGAVGGPPMDPALLKQGLEELLRACDAAVCRELYQGWRTLTGDAGLAKDMAEGASLSVALCDLIAGGLARIFLKHGWTNRWGDEVIVASAAGLAIGKYTRSFGKLRELQRVKAEAEAKKTKLAAGNLAPAAAADPEQQAKSE